MGRKQKRSEMATEGEIQRTHAWLFGIVGFFFLGLFLGPMAIHSAKDAEKLGVKATGAKVLGWIDLSFGIIWVVMIIASFVS